MSSATSQVANYQPILLTCICYKLLEHIVRSEITGLLHRNIIAEAQHGFCNRRSSETQLILTVEDLAGKIDEGGGTETIPLDSLKAFDKVPLKCLLLKLDLYGTMQR